VAAAEQIEIATKSLQELANEWQEFMTDLTLVQSSSGTFAASSNCRQIRRMETSTYTTGCDRSTTTDRPCWTSLSQCMLNRNVDCC